MVDIPDSFWLDQKVAAVNHRVDYGYVGGMGYYTVPKEVYQNGFPQNMKSKANLKAFNFGQANLPSDVQDLYAPHHTTNRGYHSASVEEVMLDLAPLFPNIPDVVAGRLYWMHNDLPLAARTTNAKMETIKSVRDVDYGLTSPPQSGPFADKSNFSEPPQATPPPFNWTVGIIAAAIVYVVTRRNMA